MKAKFQVFGNKYTINRGEVRFINPTRIEPYLDVDMQTRARGIDVTMSFTGTINKLNMTYRSDPPLQPNDIIALLAMGRDPNAMAGLANAQVASQSLLQTGSGVVGQAITAPVSDRLQRFFGVSRVKIDPQLTGVENIPQARLTLEQPVSRDITLTYITNLARTNEQIVTRAMGHQPAMVGDRHSRGERRVRHRLPVQEDGSNEDRFDPDQAGGTWWRCSSAVAAFDDARVLEAIGRISCANSSCRRTSGPSRTRMLRSASGSGRPFPSLT